MTYTFTQSIEDYLEIILLLSQQQEKVRVTDIAEKLNVAKASVSQAINNLDKLKLVHKEKYGPVTLTDKGRRIAYRVKTKHNILREFLVHILKVPYDIAEKDACLMEHVVSHQTVTGIVDFLEANRSFHNLDLDFQEVKIVLATKYLNELKPGMKGKILKIEATGNLRRRILEMGMTTGDEVMIKGVAPMGDPIEVIIKDYNLSLRKNEAASIAVEVI